MSTGTGSGKTECFLYPLLDTLLKETEPQRREPGVRALLVYPLNALANDQLYKRIVPLFVHQFAGEGNRANPAHDACSSRRVAGQMYFCRRRLCRHER